MAADPTKSFTVHRRYIRAYALIAGYTNRSNEQQVLVGIAERLRPQLKQVSRPSNTTEIQSCLANAWATELLLCLSSDLEAGDEFTRITNNWAVVQAYYASFHATRALAQAHSLPRATTHPATLKHYVALWPKYPMDIYPWSLAVGPKDGPMVKPDGLNVDLSLQPLTNTVTPLNIWDFGAKAIKTTRDELLVPAYDDARKRKMAAHRKAVAEKRARRTSASRKNLTPEEKVVVESGYRYCSFLDYLYRLRLRSNYEDATMFLEGPANPQESLEVQQDIKRLLAATLLVNEMRIVPIVGQAVFRKWVDGWLASNMPKDKSVGLATRRPILISPA